MPGQTNNQTILAAENQEIVALNEIRAAIENLSTPTVTVDLSGLETAITALGVTLSSALENLNMQVTQTNNNCCCGGSGGTTTTPPTTPTPTPGGGQPGAGGPGDPPPSGSNPPSGTPQEVKARQCKAAMFVVDTLLIDVIAKMDQYYLDDTINLVFNGIEAVLNVTGVVEAATGILASVIPPAGAALLAAGVGSAALAVALEKLEVDFSDLSNWLQTNRDELVCALANAEYPVAARLNLNFVVNSSSPNLDLGNQLFLNNILPPVIFDFLFYVETQLHVLEPKLTSITEPCPCGDIDPTETTPTDEYKCQAANYIFDSFTDTIANFGGVSNMSWYSVASFIAALGSGLLSNMFAGLFGLLFTGLASVVTSVISYLGRLYWKGTDYFEPFGEIAAQFQANKEAIICELYEAETVAAARAALEVHISDYVGSVMTANPQWADEQETYISTVTSLLPNVVLNELFSTVERAEIGNYAPPDFVECVGCGGPPPDYIVWRNADGYSASSQITEVQPGMYDIEGYSIGGGYGLVIEYTLGTQYNFLVALQSGQLSVHPSVGLRPIFKNIISGYPSSPLGRYNGDAFPSPAVQCFNFLEIYSAVPFTIRLSQSNQCT